MSKQKIVSVNVEAAKAKITETGKKLRENVLGRVMEAGIKITEKQLSFLQKVQSKYKS